MFVNFVDFLLFKCQYGRNKRRNIFQRLRMSTNAYYHIHEPCPKIIYVTALYYSVFLKHLKYTVDNFLTELCNKKYLR